MALVIPEGFAQVSHLFTGSALPNGAAVTWGLDYAGVSDGDIVAEAMHTAFTSNVLPLLTDDVTCTTTVVKYGPVVDGPTFEFVDPVVGGNVTQTTTPNVSILVTKRTAAGGRRNRGRMYLPGLGEGSVAESGIINGDFVTNLQAAIDAWRDDVVGGTIEYRQMILHSTSLNSPTPAPTEVTSLVVSALAATQRRRMRR